MIEEQIKFIQNAKHSTKEKFLEQYPNHGNIWELLQNSKEGYIYIEKISSNTGYLRKSEGIRGYTPAFGVGLSCWVDNKDEYYYTSNVQSINWEDKTFKTLNSTYKFEFYGNTNQEA